IWTENSSLQESLTLGQQNSASTGSGCGLGFYKAQVLEGWITRANTYFEVQKTLDEVKVKLAKLSMDGTIHYFNLLKETEEHLTRARLKHTMIEHYRGVYCKFLIHPVTGEMFTEEQCMEYFIWGGLCLDLGNRVRTFNPQNQLEFGRQLGDRDKHGKRAEQYGCLITRE
ncbi:hypothetical protein CR513_39981, partial [Mucuna pruriens]